MAATKRTVAIGMEYSPSSKAAARWAADNLLKTGDRVVLVHVLSKGADASHKELWKNTGSPLIPLSEFMEMNLQARYGVDTDKEVLEILQSVAKSKKRVQHLKKFYFHFQDYVDLIIWKLSGVQRQLEKSRVQLQLLAVASRAKVACVAN